MVGACAKNIEKKTMLLATPRRTALLHATPRHAEQSQNASVA
jgi:hypothetical protein